MSLFCLFVGDWVYGLREGKGHEATRSGTHNGEWKANNKHGSGTEKTLVGTLYEGRWMSNQKSSHGVRKMVTGDQEEQASIELQLEQAVRNYTHSVLTYRYGMLVTWYQRITAWRVLNYPSCRVLTTSTYLCICIHWYDSIIKKYIARYIRSKILICI